VRFSQEPLNIEEVNQTKLETNQFETNKSLDTIQSYQNAQRDAIKSAEQFPRNTNYHLVNPVSEENNKIRNISNRMRKNNTLKTQN
jgi:hypothetical protein